MLRADFIVATGGCLELLTLQVMLTISMLIKCWVDGNEVSFQNGALNIFILGYVILVHFELVT